ncbi:uncharacterized protein LOC124658289 [Lolium rigidum]|uniref:uncharacterized protein LOC124658289 n=1 Tax=Lolium rigidum TaxID=89674 RepID=UPI001F5CB39E|nr:uncharacterized protein LOC124658289 [Lolium rigidum]
MHLSDFLFLSCRRICADYVANPLSYCFGELYIQFRFRMSAPFLLACGGSKSKLKASKPALIVCYHIIISSIFRHNLIGKKGGCHVLWVQTSVLLEAETRIHLAVCVSVVGECIPYLY